jgi:RNA polymerase sigma-70 factor (ECF subfamily)
MNDEHANQLTELAGLYGHMVFTTAYRILGNAEDAEDALQEVFLKMLTTWTGQFRPEAVRNWGGYLRGAAVRCAIDLLRRKKRWRREGAELAEDVAAPPGLDPRTLAIGRQRSRLLRQALAQLPGRDARIFAMRYFEEFSYEEIAAHTGMTANRVGVILHRARKRLEDILEPAVSSGSAGVGGGGAGIAPRLGKESNHVSA